MGASVGIGIESATTPGADDFDAIEIQLRMDTLEVFATGCNRFKRDQGVDKISASGTGEHRLEAFRTFRVPGTGEMLEVRGMSTEQHGHQTDATVQGW